MTNLRSVIGVFDPETEGDEESRRGAREKRLRRTRVEAARANRRWIELTEERVELRDDSDWDYASGERAIIGTTRVTLRGEGNLFHNDGIRVEDWTDVDFETVFPTLIFQGGRFDSFSDEGWNRL